MRVPLDRGLNVAILHIAGRLLPGGFDVSADAPDTYPGLMAHIAATGRICVWNGASDDTIYADKEVNYAFRAWHDWCHWFGHYDFSLGGERQAAELQKSHLRSLYCGGSFLKRWEAIIDAEVVGQAEHFEHWGEFPVDQLEFVKGYMANPKMFYGLPTFSERQAA